MKSLDQIEARAAITNTGSLVTISQPGSYYLTHNLTVSTGDAIDIATNGVTLDLNGFTLSSTAASATGVAIYLTASAGNNNITIVNGCIRSGVTNNGSGVYSGSGFSSGIYSSGYPPVNVRVANLSVYGCLNYGIYLNYNDTIVVESCVVRTIGGLGILGGIVKNSVAMDCGSTAIYGDQVSDCRGVSSLSGYGIYASSTAQNCYGASSSLDGISAETALNCQGVSSTGIGVNAGSIAQNCYGASAGGFYAVSASSALNCRGSSTSGKGVAATMAQNCYGDSSTDTGLYAYSAENCYGSSGTGIGIAATTAQNSYGSSTSNYGLLASDVAIGCHGYSYSGTGLNAFIANSCHGASNLGTALTTTHNVNSF